MKNVKENGITLIALVVTIVVLLILAGVSIAMLAGEDGIIRQAQNAKKETIHAEVKEAVIMKYEEYQIELKTAQNAQTFIEFLDDKEYINSEGTVNVKNLTGKKLGLGNGTDNKTDVYKIEMEESYYVLNYYGEKKEKTELSVIAATQNISTGDETAPEEYKWSFRAGDNITAYVVENAESIEGEECYDMIFVGTGDMYSIDDWDCEEPVIGTGESEENYIAIHISEIEISDGITSIGNRAFEGCWSLANITIPDSVTSIGISAFAGCTSLANITIPDSVTSIGYEAFYGCGSLTSITIPDSVTSIGYEAFYGCRSLTSITIPDSVTSIGGFAFARCSSLTSITIPDSVTSMGVSAFYNTAWYNSQPDGPVYLGNIYYKYKGTMPDDISIREGTITIADEAFYNDWNLNSITIPTSVKNIGYYAFAGCKWDLVVNYDGTQEQWSQINIGSGNGALTKVEEDYIETPE